MIGLIKTAYDLAGLVSGGINKNIKDTISKAKYFDKETNTYVDCDGITRDIITNEYRYISIPAIDGSQKIYDKNGIVIKTIQKNKVEFFDTLEGYIEKVKKDPKKHIYPADNHKIVETFIHGVSNQLACGRRFIDKETGREVVLRYLTFPIEKQNYIIYNRYPVSNTESMMVMDAITGELMYPNTFVENIAYSIAKSIDFKGSADATIGFYHTLKSCENHRNKEHAIMGNYDYFCYQDYYFNNTYLNNDYLSDRMDGVSVY